jgi:RNA polymerase sigma factor (sigma-70 family)
VIDRTDSHLLRTYADRRLEPAFTELVRRHVDFVYSAAIRMVRDPHLAEDVTQGVFIALAKQAPELVAHATLVGWLHRTAQNIAAQTVRTIERRRAREQEVVAMNELLASSPEAPWEQIAPHLDAALGELTEADRDAVLLRYFARKSAAEMGKILGISDEAAQKRVSRAVERLREFFTKRNLTVGAGGLTVLISANAVESAPAGLAATISAAALAGTAVSTSTLIAATTKIIAMTTLQRTLVTVTVAALAGAGIYEANQAAQLRGRVEAFQQQQAPLAEQMRKWQISFADATNRLADLLAENSQLRSNFQRKELLQLRGAVARLRNDADQVNDPAVQQALRRKANVERMKQLFREHPDQQIPELQLLSEQDFFDLARDQDLESSNGIRTAFSEIRNSAENQFAIQLQQALQKFFYQANSNQPPDTILALAPFFDPPTDNAILQHYHLIETGKSVVAGWAGGWAISQTDTPDLGYDSQWFISPVGFSSAPFNQTRKQ